MIAIHPFSRATAPDGPLSGHNRGVPTDSAPGIVIREAHVGAHAEPVTPRIPVFVYGETCPEVPTLPFGRWRVRTGE
jgi:hypothetical protein